MSAQTKVTSLSQLKAGSVIKIYPRDSEGTSRYAESDYALACSDDGYLLTYYKVAKSGDEWILEYAGNDSYYIKNNNGCYWTNQEPSDNGCWITCTIDKSSAVKISLTWDNKEGGVCFWNEKNGYGLRNHKYGQSVWVWGISPDQVFFVSGNVFDIALLKENSGNDFAKVTAVVDEIRYRFDTKQKTAEVLKNGYSGDIVIPENVIYNNVTYKVTSLFSSSFYGCKNLTSISLPSTLTSLGDYCFSGCSSLTNISLPSNLTSLGDDCFYGCSSLTNISLPSNLTSLGVYCFGLCSSLTSIDLPSSLTSLEEGCFYKCSALKSIS